MATLSSEDLQHPDGGRAYFGLVTRDDGALAQILAHVAHHS
jgi:hypothetical protein